MLTKSINTQVREQSAAYFLKALESPTGYGIRVSDENDFDAMVEWINNDVNIEKIRYLGNREWIKKLDLMLYTAKMGSPFVWEIIRGSHTE